MVRHDEVDFHHDIVLEGNVMIAENLDYDLNRVVDQWFQVALHNLCYENHLLMGLLLLHLFVVVRTIVMVNLHLSRESDVVQEEEEEHFVNVVEW